MKIKWYQLFFKLFIWLVLEITFTLLGFDDLADYSEFILEIKKNYTHLIYNKSYTHLDLV